MLFKSKMKHSQFNESLTEYDETEYLNKISDQITEYSNNSGLIQKP